MLVFGSYCIYLRHWSLHIQGLPYDVPHNIKNAICFISLHKTLFLGSGRVVEHARRLRLHPVALRVQRGTGMHDREYAQDGRAAQRQEQGEAEPAPLRCQVRCETNGPYQ